MIDNAAPHIVDQRVCRVMQRCPPHVILCVRICVGLKRTILGHTVIQDNTLVQLLAHLQMTTETGAPQSINTLKTSTQDTDA